MTKTLIAKPVIKDKFWIITDGKDKVGNVIAQPEGYNLILNGNVEYFRNTASIKKQFHIDFTNIKIDKQKTPLPYQQFPTPKRIYNSVFDIKRKIHIFTKSLNSKCYYAAGWYHFYEDSDLGIQCCPKYIFIQRYKYMGPYKSKDEIEVDK